MALSAGLILLAKGVLTAAIGPFIEEARDAVVNATQDTIRETVSGRMSIDEWAKVVVEGVETVKERAIEEEHLRFVGGKMKFSVSKDDINVVNVSFQLYFLDEMGKWKKAEADSNIPKAKFSFEALNDLETEKEIIFEVE